MCADAQFVDSKTCRFRSTAIAPTLLTALRSRKSLLDGRTLLVFGGSMALSEELTGALERASRGRRVPRDNISKKCSFEPGIT